MKVRDLEEAIDAINEPNDLYELISYFSKDEALWLLSEVKRRKYECVGQVLTDLINGSRPRL